LDGTRCREGTGWKVLTTVAELMTREVVTVGLDDDLRIVRDKFQKFGFHHLLVVENGRLLGVISDRDLLKALSPFIGTLSEQERDLATLSRRAHRIMTARLITIGPEATVQEAADLLVRHRISCLPVVSATGAIEGILTWKDILRWLVSLSPGEGAEGQALSASQRSGSETS
jgi:acetoin utilization protein AcuB